MRYYTYAYLREDGTPYYIGKGTKRRVYQRHNGFYPPSKDRIIFLKKNLTEDEAFKHEIYMIAVFGRKDLGTGILHNKTNGGEGVSGVCMSEERRKLCGSMKGKKFSEEHKRKIGESNRGKPRQTKEGLERLAKMQKESIGKSKKPHSLSAKLKMSESAKGRIPWNKGKKVSQISGGKNPKAKKIEFDKVVYDCIKDASEKTGKSVYCIRKYGICV